MQEDAAERAAALIDTPTSSAGRSRDESTVTHRRHALVRNP
jgi:hypothetical protein